MKPKSNAAIQLGMDRATAFNLIAVIGKAAVAGKWDLPHGMLGTESDANQDARPRIVNRKRGLTFGPHAERCPDALRASLASGKLTDTLTPSGSFTFSMLTYPP